MDAVSAEWRRQLGRTTWRTIHSMVYGIDTMVRTHSHSIQAAKQSYVDMIKAALALYPCDACSVHVATCCNQELHKLHELNRVDHSTSEDAIGDLERWGYNFHQFVSTELDPTAPPPLNDSATAEEISSYMRRMYASPAESGMCI